MSVERKLKKISENEFLLVVNDKENRHLSEKGYNRDELREIYDSLKLQYEQMRMALRENNKKLAGLKVDISDKEKELLELMEKATKHNQYLELQKQVDKQAEDRDTFKKQMKEIEQAVPEVLRKKK